MNTIRLHDAARVAFDHLLMTFDDMITLSTAAALAKDLGICDYDPRNYEN
jgi:hypothetical protein